MGIDYDSLSKEEKEFLLETPLADTPPGIESRLGQPRKLNAMTIALNISALFIITLVFFLRAYSKIFYTRKIRIEDVFGTIAYAACIGYCYTVVQMDINPGTFINSWDITIRDLEPYTKNLTLLRTFYCIDLAFCKNAILLEWIHTFVPLHQRTVLFWSCIVLIAANTLMYTAAIIANYIVVLPREALWKPWIDAQHPINRKAADFAVVIFNLVCDILILILPQRVIWKLKLHRKRRLGLSFIFGLGLLTCVCAGGRLHNIITIDPQERDYDIPGVVLWAFGESTFAMMLWGVGESTFAMMVFCIPAIPKMFSGMQTGLLSRVNKSLRTWAKRISGSSRAASNPRSTNQQSWPNAGTSGIYNEITGGESELALMDIDNREAQRTGRNTGGERIIKTTEIFIMEDSSSAHRMPPARYQSQSLRHY